MHKQRLAIFATLVVATATAPGCGESKSSGTKAGAQARSASTTPPVKRHSGPLTRSQLIARGDAICFRLNARRSSTRISKPEDYETILQAVAADEMAGADEMSRLTPPRSMAKAWQEMIGASRTIARMTGAVHNAKQATEENRMRALDVVLTKGIDTLTTNARHEGFKDCAKFV